MYWTRFLKLSPCKLQARMAGQTNAGCLRRVHLGSTSQHTIVRVVFFAYATRFYQHFWFRRRRQSLDLLLQRRKILYDVLFPVVVPMSNPDVPDRISLWLWGSWNGGLPSQLEKFLPPPDLPYVGRSRPRQFYSRILLLQVLKRLIGFRSWWYAMVGMGDDVSA